MTTRILKTKHGQFERATWNGTNPSGITPVCDRVLVRPDQHASKTAGGIHIADDLAERQTMGATTGVLIATGPQAFTYDSSGLNRWDHDKPEPGTRVCFARYAGEEYMGDDGLLYRVMDYRSIGGTMGAADNDEGPQIVLTGGNIIMSNRSEEAA